MPTTQLEFPILARFLCIVEMTTGQPTLPQEQEKQQPALPPGIVLGPDGKPCRTCTSGAQWRSMMKTSTAPQKPTAAATKPTTTDDCPPDVEQLGRSTWTLLHTLTANYPEKPSTTQQTETKQFMTLFGKYYPCWVCADDFRAWMKSGNEPRVSNREEFGRWMCEAHNAVNSKLGKEAFDCNRWEERWRTGLRDGRCD